MLFNSFPFLFVFLPVAVILHIAVERFRPAWRLWLLIILSLCFYSYWDWRFLPLMVVSILLNWLLAEAFTKTKQGGLIVAAIVINLLVLAFFKYFNFFVDTIDLIPGVELPHSDIILPLGISFFTFHHVMYLMDLKRGKAPRFDLTHYALYISFFPQVLAGPLVRWTEVMHQFDERPYLRPDAVERFGRGCMLLSIGLAKKVLLADPLVEYFRPVFNQVIAGHSVTVLEAWQATLSFTLNVYFDFSGYTDMALGIALMFGIVLPQNFDIPFRATSLSDFWRRWHMTLSRFLRDYLYISFGGNRHGLPIQLLALFATMALGGLWHGAGLNYVVWGITHGIGLCFVLLWKRMKLPMPAFLGWLLTYLYFCFTLVIFPEGMTFSTVADMYHSLLGLAPLGDEFKWRTLAVAAAFAFIGPTSWNVVHRLPPRAWVAITFALLTALVLFRIGDDANYEFLYFQF